MKFNKKQLFIKSRQKNLLKHCKSHRKNLHNYLKSAHKNLHKLIKASCKNIIDDFAKKNYENYIYI